MRSYHAKELVDALAQSQRHEPRDTQHQDVQRIELRPRRAAHNAGAHKDPVAAAERHRLQQRPDPAAAVAVAVVVVVVGGGR